jgi:uncharacterized protein (DUF1501 family)
MTRSASGRNCTSFGSTFRPFAGSSTASFSLPIFAGDDSIDALIDSIVRQAYIEPGTTSFSPVQTWRDAAIGLTMDRTRAAMSPAPSSAYPDDEFAQGLAGAAHLIKSDPGLAVIALDLAGWDTHSNQGGVEGRHATQLDLLARSLDAFWFDLGSRQSDVAVLVQTEFGRTLHENASHGTDHGRAATWMILGSGLSGGFLFGQSGWPGLADAQLVDGRYLAYTVDYRDVYAELLQAHLGCNNVDDIIPQRPGQPVGIF